MKININELETGDIFICHVTGIKQKVIKIYNNIVYTEDENGIIRTAFRIR